MYLFNSCALYASYILWIIIIIINLINILKNSNHVRMNDIANLRFLLSEVDKNGYKFEKYSTVNIEIANHLQTRTSEFKRIIYKCFTRIILQCKVYKTLFYKKKYLRVLYEYYLSVLRQLCISVYKHCISVFIRIMYQCL